MNAQRQFARELAEHAIAFNDAATRLSRTTPFLFHPTFYCVLHSIELALKSHLAGAGYSRRRLSSKALGHNLGALLEAALVDPALADSNLNAFDRKAITWGAKDYSAKCFEYPEFMVSTHPIGKWLLIARKIIDSAERALGAMAV